MKIKIDTKTILESEASGVIALLMKLYPNIGETKSSLWVSYTPQTERQVGTSPALSAPFGSEQASPTAPETVYDAAAKALDTPPEHDANGRPWDARIHSTPAKQNADGTWRAKRGVAAELVAAVEAELAGSPTDELDATEEEVKTLIASEPELAATDLGEAVAEITEDNRHEEVAVSPPAPPAPPPAAPVTFPVVMKKITDNKILPARVQELLAPFGIKSVGELLKPDRAADLAAFNAEIDKELAQ